MISKEEFKKHVKELLEKGGETKSLYNKLDPYTFGASIFTMIGIVLIVIGFISFSSGGIICFFLGIFMMIISASINSQKIQEKKKYRNKYIKDVLDCLLKGYDYKFDSEDKIDKSIFDESQFAQSYDLYNGSDKLSINIPNDDGSASSTYLTLCDLYVEEIELQRKKMGDHYTTEKVRVNVYNGVFGYVEFPFQFNCVLSLNVKYSKSGVVLEKVQLEDIDFHKKYGVYCTDQIEARYILTPDMMEKLMNLYRMYKGIRIILVDNKMYISMPSENLLELSNYTGDNVTGFEGIYDDINNLLSIINEIKNNNKIFKM